VKPTVTLHGRFTTIEEDTTATAAEPITEIGPREGSIEGRFPAHAGPTGVNGGAWQATGETLAGRHGSWPKIRFGCPRGDTAASDTGRRQLLRRRVIVPPTSVRGERPGSAMWGQIIVTQPFRGIT
jgi:hypothetical protein